MQSDEEETRFGGFGPEVAVAGGLVVSAETETRALARAKQRLELAFADAVKAKSAKARADAVEANPNWFCEKLWCGCECRSKKPQGLDLDYYQGVRCNSCCGAFFLNKASKDHYYQGDEAFKMEAMEGRASLVASLLKDTELLVDSENGITGDDVKGLRGQIAELYNSAGVDVGCLAGWMNLAWDMKVFQLFNYAMTAFDLVDGGLDFAAVGQLAQHPDTVPYAVWLAVTTTISLGLEAWLKVGLWAKAAKDTKAGRGSYGILGLAEEEGKVFFIYVCALLELCVFFVEDATTMIIFWRTGLMGSTPETTANMYVTVASTALAIGGVFYGLIRLVRADAEFSSSVAVPYLVFAAILAGFLAFWMWFGIHHLLNEGHSYACLGDLSAICDGSADELLDAAAAALHQEEFTAAEFQLLAKLQGNGLLLLDTPTAALGPDGGSGLVGGGSGSGIGSMAEGDFKQLDSAVLAVYIVGWILAVLSILFLQRLL